LFFIVTGVDKPSNIGYILYMVATNNNGSLDMTITIETIKAVAKEQDRTSLEVITDAQAACVITGDESTLETLCELKNDILMEMGIL
jgi:predicted nucleic acid-binding protein